MSNTPQPSTGEVPEYSSDLQSRETPNHQFYELLEQLNQASQEKLNLQDQLNQAIQERDQLKEQNHQFKFQLEKADTEILQLKAELEEWNSRQIEYVQERNRYKDLIEQFRQEQSQLRVSLKQLQDSFQQLKQNQANATRNLELKVSDNSEIINFLETRLVKLETNWEEIAGISDRFNKVERYYQYAVQIASPSDKTSINRHTELTRSGTEESAFQSSKLDKFPSEQEVELTESYNSSPASFAEKFKVMAEVSTTAESISQSRLGAISQPIVLEEGRRGNYLIINSRGFYYLVPKGNLKITEYNYDTVQALFECRGYRAGSTETMRLLKPAWVSSITGDEKWQLDKVGILEFLN